MFTLKTLNAWGAEKDYCKQQEKIKLIEKPLMSTEQSRNSFESRTSYRVFQGGPRASKTHGSCLLGINRSQHSSFLLSRNLTQHSALLLTQEKIRVQTWLNSTLLYHSTSSGCSKPCALPAALMGILPASRNHPVVKLCSFSSAVFNVLTIKQKV